jgi:uncharacterized repeat protein (TIGR02543 family)
LRSGDPGKIGSPQSYPADFYYTSGSYAAGTFGDATLIANWTPITYTIQYWRLSNIHTYYYGDHQSATYDTEVAIKASADSRYGYTFLGWTKHVVPGAVIDCAAGATAKNLTTEQNDTINLYPVYRPNTYTVNYDGNGATSGSVASSTHIYDTPSPLTKNAFVREGYTFIGWGGGNTQLLDEANVSTLNAEDGGTTTLYALWKPHTYDVIFDPNGINVFAMPSNLKKTHDEDLEFPFLSSPKRLGYEFLGWGTTPNATEPEYWGLSIYSTNAPVKLYALWVSTASRNALRDKIYVAENTAKGNYTDASWAAFQAALTVAQDVANNYYSVQAHVDAALTALNDAYAGLQQNPAPPDTTKYISLWGKPTKYASNFGNWLMVIFLFGWIWMAF